jgi:2-deoxy-D-gluconate 3-dehydrogenase
MALGLRGAGARVAVTGREPAKNAAMADELGESGMVLGLDVRDEAAVERTVADVVEHFGSLDVLVNAAGAGAGVRPSSSSAPSGTHLTGAFLCSRAAARAIAAAGRGGKIVNIGSMYSLLGPPAFPAYGAAKTGVVGLTRALAVELAPHGIQVNAILPGFYETDLALANVTAERRREVAHRTPAGRWGRPDELIGAVVFLALARLKLRDRDRPTSRRRVLNLPSVTARMRSLAARLG